MRMDENAGNTASNDVHYEKDAVGHLSICNAQYIKQNSVFIQSHSGAVALH